MFRFSLKNRMYNGLQQFWLHYQGWNCTTVCSGKMHFENTDPGRSTFNTFLKLSGKLIIIPSNTTMYNVISSIMSMSHECSMWYRPIPSSIKICLLTSFVSVYESFMWFASYHHCVLYISLYHLIYVLMCHLVSKYFLFIECATWIACSLQTNAFVFALRVPVQYK